MRKIFLHSLMALFIIVSLLITVGQIHPKEPVAQNGILDLARYDFQSGGRLSLSGDWELYWKKFLTGVDFQNHAQLPSVYAKVPEVWNHYRLQGKNLPAFGYATYRLKLKVPDEKTPYSIHISSVSTSYQCYINDELIAENGTVSIAKEGAKPCYKPITATFLPPSKEFDVIIHVSNFTYARGGIWYDIDFGTKEQIEQLNTILKYKDGFVIGCLAITAAYVFCYFLLEKKDHMAISLLLLCFLLILRTTLYGDYFIIHLFPDIPFLFVVWAAYLTVIWSPAVLYYLVENITRSSRAKRLGKLFYSYSVIATILITFLPVSVFTRYIFPIEFIAIIISISAMYSIFLAHIKRVSGASTVLAGCIILVVSGLHDSMYHANLLHSSLGEVSPLGFVMFMFLISIFYAYKSAKNYQRVQTLSAELADKLRMEQDLTERLYSLDKLKDEFLTNTSHELRTPLNGIINIIQSVLHGIGGQINQVQRQNLEVVLNSARKLHLIINDLFDVSMFRSGGIRINPVPLDIQTLISNMLVVFRHLKKNENVTLRSEIASGFPLVLADEGRLRQILNNLVGNALKFTESGEITIGASHNGEQARIYIEDTGIGIAPDQLENIFNAFEQIDGTLQRKYKGSELGLYISRQLIELHGGKVWITSELGKGTQVFFTLPLLHGQPVEESTGPFEETEANALSFLDQEPDQKKSFYNILAVDDDLPSLKALVNILELADYHVKGVASGKEALSILEKGIPFELVILDVIMPELSGFEVLESIRKRYNRSDLPVLMLTSNAQAEDMSLCYKLGANDYLAKPFEEEELLARVNSLVRLKNAINKLISTEMSFLQAQIKPHFIHNALSVISSLSIKNPQKAKALILDLSDYLRGSFDLYNEEGLTTLSRELELVRAYLSIEQARFKERLQIHYCLAENVDCTLPLLTIQPLVENAVRHGIMCRMEGGEIHITTSKEQSFIRIEVRDNGVGIEQNRIARFFEVKQDQRGVGISNIHRRLMAHYGQGLHIESAPDQGTAISFYIPYESGEEVSE